MTDIAPPNADEFDPELLEIAARAGFSKHYGGLGATEELVDLCGIGKGDRVLDVGCGVGATPCFLAEHIGCHVVGVDLSRGMLDWAKRRAARLGLADLVRFEAADIRDLPFDDGSFDVVLCESVLVVVPDKPRAASELVRVVRVGGRVGSNEASWLQGPPPPDLAAHLAAAHLSPLTVEGYRGLLEGAGLVDVVARPHHLDARQERRERIRRYGRAAITAALFRMLWLALTSRRFRALLGQLGRPPKHLDAHFGYGIYAGRKGEARSEHANV